MPRYTHKANDGIVCDKTGNAIFKCSLKRHALPIVEDNILYTVINKAVVAAAPNGMSTFQLDFTQLKATTRINLSICKMTPIHFTGCYVYDAGALPNYLCTTDLASLNLSYNQHICTNISTFDKKCSIRCPSSTTPISISDQLFYVNSSSGWLRKRHTKKAETIQLPSLLSSITSSY
uniref:Bee-milk protein n=1 Tax=Heterorhabditis bacteriophora TaxID=37862 RepID=A0A1I7WCA8_HETBA